VVPGPVGPAATSLPDGVYAGARSRLRGVFFVAGVTGVALPGV
jgi:hypothetical protein